MNMINTNNRISIQVGLSGYSFKIYADNELVRASEWISAEKVFSTPEFHDRYAQVDVSVFTPKCTLVPVRFHDPDRETAMLSEVADIDVSGKVDSIDVTDYAAVMLYQDPVGESLAKVIASTVLRQDAAPVRPLPEMYHMLKQLAALPDYNRIIASYMDQVLYLAVAQGRTLLLCNSFSAPDFTTAEYFIFMVMKKFQLNPEMSVIYFRTPLDDEQEISLYRYFHGVEKI